MLALLGVLIGCKAGTAAQQRTEVSPEISDGLQGRAPTVGHVAKGLRNSNEWPASDLVEQSSAPPAHPAVILRLLLSNVSVTFELHLRPSAIT